MYLSLLTSFIYIPRLKSKQQPTGPLAPCKYQICGVRGDLSQLAACIELLSISFEEVCDAAKVVMIHHAN
jgi:hypothetical protein